MNVYTTNFYVNDLTVNNPYYILIRNSSVNSKIKFFVVSNDNVFVEFFEEPDYNDSGNTVYCSSLNRNNSLVSPIIISDNPSVVERGVSFFKTLVKNNFSLSEPVVLKADTDYLFSITATKTDGEVSVLFFVYEDDDNPFDNVDDSDEEVVSGDVD